MTYTDTATGEQVQDLNKANSIVNKEENEPTNPITLGDASESIGNVEQAQSTVQVDDTDYIDGYGAGISNQEILNSQVGAQSTTSKLMNSIGRGIVGGTVGFGESVGALLHLVNEDLGKDIMNFSSEVKEDVLDSAMKVYQQRLGEDAGYLEHIARWDVLESGVSSIVQFGVGGMGVSAGFKLLGKGLVKAGLTNAAINGAGGAADLLAKTGRFLESGKTVSILGKGVNSTAIQSGLTTNLLEGRIMARELEKELTLMNKGLLYNPNVSEEEKEGIRSDIRNAGQRMLMYNTALAAVDIAGFASLHKYSRGGQGAPTVGNWVKSQVKMAPKESAEEVIQNVIQMESGHTATEDVKKRLETSTNLFERDDESWDEMMARAFEERDIGSGEAGKGSYAKFLGTTAKGFGGRILSFATSKQAVTEGFVGLVSGPGQWMATGAFSAYKGHEAAVLRYEESLQFKDKATDTLQQLVDLSIGGSNELGSIVEDAQKVYGEGTIEEELVTKHAVENLVADAVASGFNEELLELLDEEQVGEAEEDATDREKNQRATIVDSIKESIAKYSDLSAFHGSDAIRSQALKIAALNTNISLLEEAKKAHIAELKLAEKGTKTEAELEAAKERREVAEGKREEVEGAAVENVKVGEISTLMNEYKEALTEAKQGMEYMQSPAGQREVMLAQKLVAGHSKSMSQINEMKNSKKLDTLITKYEDDLEQADNDIDRAAFTELIVLAKARKEVLAKTKAEKENTKKKEEGQGTLNTGGDIAEDGTDTTVTDTESTSTAGLSMQDVVEALAMDLDFQESYNKFLDANTLDEETVEFQEASKQELAKYNAGLVVEGAFGQGGVNNMLSEINNAYGQTSAQEVKMDLNDSEGITNKARLKAVKSIAALMEATMNVSNGESLPSFKTFMSFMGDVGASLEQHFDTLKMMYEANTGRVVSETYATLGNIQPYEKDNSENKNNPPADTTGDKYSWASYHLTGSAITWTTDEDGEYPLLDYNTYKEGTKITLVVENDYVGPIKLDTNVEVSWEEVKNNTDSAGNFTFTNANGEETKYVTDHLRPIAVVDELGTKLGYVHTMQWSDNSTRMGDKDNAAAVIAVRADILKIRNAVLKAKGQSVSTKILNRAISLNPDYASGTAINRNPELGEASVEIDVNDNPILSVQTSKEGTFRHFFDVDKNSQIASNPLLEDGTTVFLVPLEGATDSEGRPMYYAEPLHIKQLNAGEGKILTDLLRVATGLGTEDNLMLDAIKSFKDGTISPSDVKGFLENFINTETNLDVISNPSVPKFNVTASGSLLTIRVKQSSRDITVKIDYSGNSPVVTEGTANALSSFSALLDVISQPFHSEEDNLLPYFNVSGKKLSRPGKPKNKVKTFQHSIVDGAPIIKAVTYENYDEVVLNHALTYIAQTGRVANAPSYVVNTVVVFDSSDFELTAAEKAKAKKDEATRQKEAEKRIKLGEAEAELVKLDKEILEKENQIVAINEITDDLMEGNLTGDKTFNKTHKVLHPTYLKFLQLNYGLAKRIKSASKNGVVLDADVITDLFKKAAPGTLKKSEAEVEKLLSKITAVLNLPSNEATLKFLANAGIKEYFNDVNRSALNAEIKKLKEKKVPFTKIVKANSKVDMYFAPVNTDSKPVADKAFGEDLDLGDLDLTDVNVESTAAELEAEEVANTESLRKFYTLQTKKIKEKEKEAKVVEEKKVPTKKAETIAEEEQTIEDEIEIIKQKKADEVGEEPINLDTEDNSAIEDSNEEVLNEDEAEEDKDRINVKDFTIEEGVNSYGKFPSLKRLISSIRTLKGRSIMFTKALQMVTLNKEVTVKDRDDIVNNALANFQYKREKEDGIYSFQSTEIGQIAKSLTSKIMYGVANSPASVPVRQIFAEASAEIQSDLIVLAKTLDDYIARHDNTLIDESIIKKAKQLRSSIQTSITNRKAMHRITTIGLGNAMVVLNMKSGTVDEEGNFEESESRNRAGSLERLVFTDDFNLTQQAEKGLSAKVQAKMLLFRSYRIDPNNSDNMVPRRDILNNIEYESKAFVTLLNITKGLYDYSIESKLAIIKDRLATAKSIQNSRMIFLQDVVALLEAKRGTANSLTEVERNQFNTVLNKTEVVMAGLNVNSNQFNEEVNNFSSNYKTFMLTLQEKLETITEREPTTQRMLLSTMGSTRKDVKSVGVLEKLSASDAAQAVRDSSIESNISLLNKLGRSTNTNVESFTIVKDVLREKVRTVFNTLEVSLDEGSLNTMLDMVAFNTPIEAVDYNGDSKGKSAMFNVVLAKTFQNITTYLNTKSNKNGRYITRQFNALINWVFNTNDFEYTSSSFRSGTKVISSFSNPSLLTKFFVRVRTDRFFEENKSDLYKGRSRLLNLINNNKGFPTENADGTMSAAGLIGRVLNDSKYQSLLSTWESSERVSDTIKQQMNYTLGHFMSNGGYSDKQKEGDEYLDLTDTIGSKEHKIRARRAKYTTKAFSDKKRVFLMEGLAFDSVINMPSGNSTVTLDRDHVEYLTDAILGPEIARYLAFKNQEVNVSGFAKETIFTIPSLNDNARFKTLLDNYANANGSNIRSLFEGKAAEIGKIAAEALEIQLHKQKDATIAQMVKSGIINKGKHGYILAKKYETIKEYKALLADSTSITVSNTGEVVNSEKVEEDRVKDEAIVSALFDAYDSYATMVAQNIVPLTVAATTQLYNELDAVFSKKFLGTEDNFSVDGFLGKLTTTYGLDISDRNNGTATLKPDVASVTKGDQLASFANEVTELTRAEKAKEDKLKRVNKAKVGKMKRAIDLQKLEAMAMNYEFGYTFHNVNMGQLVYGDPAIASKGDFNSSIDNLGKRYARNIAPGKHSSSPDSMTVYVIYNSKNDTSLFYTGKEEIGKTTAYKANPIDRTDAQGIISARAYYADKVSEGILSTQEVELIVKADNGGAPITDKDLLHRAVITPIKPVNSGTRRITSKSGEYMDLSAYNKDSEVYLSKALAGTKGILADTRAIINQVEDEYRAMPEYAGKDVTVRFVAHSGFKTAGVAPENRLDLDEVLKLGRDENGKFRVNTNSTFVMNNDALFTQLDVTYKGKDTIKPSGQVEDLFQNSIDPSRDYTVGGKKMSGKALMERWNELLGEKFELGYGELYKVFNDTPYVTEDLTEEERLLQELTGKSKDAYGKAKEAKTAIYADFSDILNSGAFTATTMSRILKTAVENHAKTMDKQANPLVTKWLDVDESGNFKYNLALSPHTQEYLDALRATIENVTIKTPRKGNSYVLMSDKWIDFNNLGDSGIILKEGFVPDPSGRLRPAMPGKGTDQGTPAQVIVSWDFKVGNAKDKNGATIDITPYLDEVDGRQILKLDKLPKELFEAIGFRTPNQDYNSQSSVEIVGFFPQGMQATIIAPMEFIDLMGSDFDVDKLYAYLKNLLRNKDGDIVKVTKDNLKELGLDNQFKYESQLIQDEMMDIINAVLLDSKIINDEILTPLSDKVLTDIGDRIMKIKGIGEEYSLPYSAAFNMEKRINAFDAGDAVSIFALLTRVNSQFRDKGLPLYEKGINETSGESRVNESVIFFGDTAFSEWARSDKHKFASVDKTKTAHDFHKPKNSISAFLSGAVDNEVLQVLHKLHMGPNTYGAYSGLTFLGFRADVSAAMITNRVMDLGKSDLEAMLTLYNKTKVGTSDDLTLEDLSGGTLRLPGMEQDKVSEDVLVEALLDLSTTMEKMKDVGTDAFKNPTELERAAILNAISLKAFVDSVASSYSATTKPLRWLVNTDSKGIQRELSALGSNLNAIQIEGFDKARDILFNLPKSKANFEVSTLMNDYAKEMLSSAPIVLKALDAAGKLGITFNSMNDIQRVVKGRVFRRASPSTYSLTQRINTIMRSNDPDLMELKRNNIFLSRLSATGKSIVFRNTGIQDPVDISYDLAGLSKLGTIGGIDMSLLYTDLIAYSMVNDRRTPFPRSFSSFIDPGEVTTMFNNNVDAAPMDPLEVIAMAAFTNAKMYASLPTEDTLKPQHNLYAGEAELNGIMQPTISISEGSINGKPKVFRTYLESDISVFYSSGTSRLDRIFSDEEESITLNNDGEVIQDDLTFSTNTEKVTVADFNKTLERTLSRTQDVGVKQFLKATLGTELKLFKAFKGIGYTVHGKGKLNKEQIALHKKLVVLNSKADLSPMEFAGLLVHELTHVSLSAAVRNIKKGRTQGMSKTMNKELNRVLRTLDGGRKEVINTSIALALFDSSTDEEKLKLVNATNFDSVADFLEAQGSLIDQYPTKAELVTGTVDVVANFLDGMEGVLEAGETLTKEDIISDIRSGNIAIDTSKSGSFITIKSHIDDSVVVGYGVDVEFQQLLDVVKGSSLSYAGYESVVESEDESLLSTGDVRGRVYSVSKFLYGLSSLNEFVASVYEFGTNNINGYSYDGLTGKGYEAAADSMPKGVVGFFADMFKMLQELLSSIFNINSNDYHKDVLYATSLLKNSTFTTTHSGGGVTSMSFTKIANDIINSCK